MSDRRTHAIQVAAGARSSDTASRAHLAVRELQKRGAQVNFAAVAAIAGVSRQFLYTNLELREQINRLRAEHRANLSAPSAAERSTDASLRSRLRGALEDNERLRRENSALREELALAHGRVRDSRARSHARRGVT